MSHAPICAGGPVELLPSLWRLVASQVLPSELPAVKSALGTELVERSMELHAEVASLMELWWEAHSACVGLDGCLPQETDVRALLAAPPHLKELVRQELRLLLLSLQQKASQEGRDAAGAIAKYRPHVVSFALGPHVRQDRSLPRRTSTSPGPGLIQHLEPLKDKLSVSHIDQVQAHLRALLEEECRILERQVEHLQHCLEEEHRVAAGSVRLVQDPTMAELQEQRRAMEWDLQLGHATLGPGPSQVFQPPGPVTPQQSSCTMDVGCPAPACASPDLAPAAPSPLGCRAPALSAAGASVDWSHPGRCNHSLGSLAGGLCGGRAHASPACGQGQTDSGTKCQDPLTPLLWGAGSPPASPACSHLVPLPAAPGPNLAFRPMPPAVQHPPPRPFSCRRLRLLGCQEPP